MTSFYRACRHIQNIIFIIKIVLLLFKIIYKCLLSLHICPCIHAIRTMYSNMSGFIYIFIVIYLTGDLPSSTIWHLYANTHTLGQKDLNTSNNL